MANTDKSRYSSFWIILLVLLLILGGLVLFRDVLSGNQRADVKPPPQPAGVEWTSAPETGVDVDLPDTPLRAAEPEADAEAEAEEPTNEAE